MINKSGFISVNNLISKKNINKIKREIINYGKKISNKNFKDLNTLLSSLEKKQITNLYNFTQYYLFKNSFISLRLIREKLNLKNKKIIENIPAVRFDFPNDKKFSLGWHQEINNPGKFGRKFFQIWVPLSISKINGGGLHIKLNKKNKVFRHKLIKNKQLRKYEIINQSSKQFKRLKDIKIEKKVGEGLILFPKTIHKTMRNNSNVIRLTFTQSFHIVEKGTNFPKIHLVK
tara:strand:+ start:20 stop:712 length:693 start_codon:yes stop_codon:yes gene_type:complete